MRWGSPPKWLLLGVLLLMRSPRQASALDPGCPMGQYGYDVWQTTEGLPGNNVHAITQTRDGYLWLGTREGLARFNGIDFAVFDTRNTPQLPDGEILSLAPGQNGALWIGLKNGLVRSRKGLFERASVQVKGDLYGLPLLGSLDGSIWMGGNPLRRLTETTNESYVIKDLQAVQALCPARQGGLWIASPRSAGRWQNGLFTELDEVRAAIGQGVVTSVCESRAGVLWIGTEAGLLRIVDGKVRRFTTGDGLSNDHIRALHEDRDGVLWIGTGYGLNRFADGHFSSASEILHNEFIFCIYEDQEGSLWIGTHQGLHRLRNRLVRVYGAKDGLFHEVVNAIAEDSQGRIFVGTWLGGLYTLENSKFSRLSAPAMPDTAITSLYPENDGGITIGTTKGVGRLLDGELTSLTNWLGVSSRALQVHRDADGRLWVGADNGLKQQEKGRFTAVPHLPARQVTALFETSDGTIWAGLHNSGVFRLQGGQWLRYDQSDGLCHPTVTAFCEARNRLWLGTEGGLVAFQDGKFFRSMIRANGLPHDDIRSLLSDTRQNLWVCSSKSLFRIQADDLEDFLAGRNDQVTPYLVGKSDGLRTSEWTLHHRGACRTKEGLLWFPSDRGALVIDPERFRTNERPPEIVLEKILINRQPVAMDRPLELRPGQRELEFHFAALSLLVPPKVRHRYRMTGHDQDWIEAGSRRVAYYSNLRPGKYRFVVLASNNDGVWNSKGASVWLTVYPPFYKTWWFIGIVSVTGLAAVVGVSRYVFLRRFRRRLELLRQQNALNVERARIAQDIHDDLGASLTQITLLSDLGRRNHRQPERAEDFFARISSTARQVVESMDEIVWSLNPRNDTLDHLANYLAKYTAEFLQLASISCRLEMPSRLPSHALTSGFRLAIFMVVKEALNNFVKHSKASEVTLRLSVAEDQLCVSIRDNGQGFDPGSVNPERHGLSSMRARIEEMGGSFHINSQPGLGTELVWRVGLPGTM